MSKRPTKQTGARLRRGTMAVLLALGLPAQATAACMRGINLSGAEFGDLPGEYN